MYCPTCKCQVSPVIAEYDFWLRTGAPMMYNVTAQIQEVLGGTFRATTTSFGDDEKEARLVGLGPTHESAIAHLREQLGHKPKEVAT